MEDTAALSPGAVRTRGEPVSRQDVMSLAGRLAVADPEVSIHGRVVGRYAAMTARRLGFPRTTADDLRVAGELHDIGKLELPRRILDKPGPLTEREWTRIRTHPVIGADLIRRAGLGEIAGWVSAHHERPDGRGYPRGLRAPEISIESAVLAVADAYHAMTTDRPYKVAMDPVSALAELSRGSGTQFDPVVVDAFVPLHGKTALDTSSL